MNPKPRPNHKLYLEILRRMTPQEKLQKVFEMKELANQLFRDGLRKRFPKASEEEIHKIYLERIQKCHNRNW